MKPSSYYDRLVDVIGELMTFTLLTRDRADYLVDRHSKRKASRRISEHVALRAEAMRHEGAGT